MAFSDQAIGFYLEAEDVNLSSALDKAEKAWAKYTKSLEKFNQRAFESHNKGLQAVKQMMEAATALPDHVAKQIDKASALVARTIRPITQEVKLDVSARSTTGLRRVVGKAVMDAMEGANIRLGASFPNRQLAMFNSDLALRTQYQRMTQPPDMKGKIEPLKKFREGGVVEGPNKAFDSVLALLQPGEMVLPRDVTQQLGRLGGRLLHKGTQVEQDEIKDLIRLTRRYGKELEPITEELMRMDEEFVDLSFTAKQRLGSTMLQVTKRANALNEGIEEIGETSETLFGKLLSHARFQTLNDALDSLHDGFQSLRGGVTSAFTQADGQQIGTFVESINRMNQFLGMGRFELAVFKERAFDAAAALDGVSVDEFAGALLTAAEAGIRTEETLFRVASAASAAAKGTDIAVDSAVRLGYELTESRNFTQESFESILATNAKLSQDFNVRASTLQAQTEKNLNTLTATLETLTEEQGRNLLISFNRIGAALPSSFVDASDEIQDVLGKALEGDPQALQQAGLLFGKPINQLREDLVRGDLSGLFEDLQRRVDGLSPQQVRALSDAIGIGTADLTKFAAAGDEIAESLARSEQSIISNAEAQAVLQERAAANRTIFEQFSEQLVKTIGHFQIGPVSGVDFINFLAELNLSSVLAIGMLGKMGLSAVVTTGKFFGLGKAAAFVGTGVKAMGKGLLKSAGPLAVIAGFAGLVTTKIASLSDQIVETNTYAERGEKAALTDFGQVGADIIRVRKNIERVQRNVDLDEAAGRAANPNAVRLLDRYNAQLAELEARSRGMVAAAKGPQTPSPTSLPGVPDLSQSIPSPLSSAEMDALLASGVSVDGMDSSGTEERLDRNNALMEQMVGLMQQFVTRAGANAQPGPGRASVSTPASFGTPFGRGIAAGDL